MLKTRAVTEASICVCMCMQEHELNINWLQALNIEKKNIPKSVFAYITELARFT